MNKSKRNFLKALPMATMLPVVTIGDKQLFELKPGKRYLIKIIGDIPQAQAQHMASVLREKGFGDVLIITGECSIYELQS